MERDLKGQIRPKDEVLNDSPFLHAFINSGACDYMVWVSDITPKLQVLGRELNEYFSGRFDEIGLTPFLVNAQTLDIFDEEYSEEGQKLTTLSLLAIGYEVGNVEEVKLFTEEIIGKLTFLGPFGHDWLKDKVQTDKIASFIVACVTMGVHWKETEDGLLSKIKTPFDDAVDKLDLKGL